MQKPPSEKVPAHPPHSMEAEQSVLGGLMVDNNLWFDLADKLTPADFYRREHQVIFEVMASMLSAQATCDFVTLGERLRSIKRLEDAGGHDYLTHLATDAYSVANCLAYAQIVREHAGRRGLISVGGQIMSLGYHPNGRSLKELTETAERRLFEIRDGGAGAQDAGAPIGTFVEQAHARIDLVREKGEIPGLPTGFIDLDRMTQGLEPGDLVIVAARPSMGKTSFACCIAEHVALERRLPVAIFSLEMSGAQIAMRLLSSFGRIPLQHLRSGRLTEAEHDKLTYAERALTDAPIYVDETAAITPLDLSARARRLLARHGIKLLIIDYIQLMRVPDSENRTNEVAEISRSLKGLAKQLGIPIIALSQLNRGLENRDNKRPRLADLRESGSIEQDADLVLFVYRDEVYNPESPEKGTAEIIIGKQRNGPLDTVKTAFIGAYTRFQNLAFEGSFQ